MYRFRKSLFALIGVVTLLAIITALMPHLGYGSSGTATTGAPSSQPQNVNVVNTPTVNAQQSGIWNVGINGTPVVGLDAGNNTVKFDSVNNTVKIDPGSPIPVRDVDSPARQPFALRLVGTFQDLQLFTFLLPSGSVVPAGKRLVIEHVSAFTSLPSGQKVESIEVITLQFVGQSGIDVLGAYLGANLQATHGGLDRFVTSQPVRLYAYSGAGADAPEVQVKVSRDSDLGTGECIIAISGFLVDVP